MAHTGANFLIKVALSGAVNSAMHVMGMAPKLKAGLWAGAKQTAQSGKAPVQAAASAAAPKK